MGYGSHLGSTRDYLATHAAVVGSLYGLRETKDRWQALGVVLSCGFGLCTYQNWRCSPKVQFNSGGDNGGGTHFGGTCYISHHWWKELYNGIGDIPQPISTPLRWSKTRSIGNHLNNRLMYYNKGFSSPWLVVSESSSGLDSFLGQWQRHEDQSNHFPWLEMTIASSFEQRLVIIKNRSQCESGTGFDFYIECMPTAELQQNCTNLGCILGWSAVGLCWTARWFRAVKCLISLICPLMLLFMTREIKGHSFCFYCWQKQQEPKKSQ
jgi:hypothetical protein